MKEAERLLKALANRRRLAIVKYLRTQGEASVGDIAVAIKLSLTATSKHLMLLQAADIVAHEQRSLLRYYRLASPLPRLIKPVVANL